jgi:hypothetical protein
VLDAMLPVASWRGDRGEVTISRLESRLVYLRLAGIADQPASKVIEQALDQVFSQTRSVVLFWDLEKLVNYHSDVRVCSTNVMLAHRARLKAVHAYSTSKIVAMGMAVVSLALGGLIQMHKNRLAFETALRAASHGLGT